METTATILHADLDAFYASVEQLLDPSLRGKPIAVGGGVVLAASYEAKAFGVRGGMPGRRARELCPQLIFVGGHFSDYQRLGDAAIKVLERFHASGRADLHRRGLCRRRGLHPSVRLAGRDCEARSGAACGRSSAFRSRSASRAPNIWRRLPRKWPSPTGWSVVDPDDRTRLPARPAGRADVGRRPGHQGAAGRDRRASPSGSWRRPRDGRSSGCLVAAAGGEARSAGVEPRSARNQDPSPRAIGRRAVGARQEARAKSGSSDPRCFISRTGSPAGCAPSRGPAGP